MAVRFQPSQPREWSLEDPRRRRALKPGLNDLIDAGVLHAGEPLFLSYKGTEQCAALLGTGEIEFEDGRIFSTPAVAAQSAKGVRADPGWTSWHVQRGRKRVSLFDLRARYLDEIATRPDLAPLEGSLGEIHAGAGDGRLQAALYDVATSVYRDLTPDERARVDAHEGDLYGRLAAEGFLADGDRLSLS